VEELDSEEPEPQEREELGTPRASTHIYKSTHTHTHIHINRFSDLCIFSDALKSLATHTHTHIYI
jgi:hypothetical protein